MPDEAAYDESLEAAYDDAAGDGEEDFEVGMKQNAMERDAVHRV